MLGPSRCRSGQRTTLGSGVPQGSVAPELAVYEHLLHVTVRESCAYKASSNVASVPPVSLTMPLAPWYHRFTSRVLI